MHFELESHLSAVIRRELGEKLAFSGGFVHVSAEVRVGMVVPDILALRTRRTPARVVPLSNLDSWVLAELTPGKPRRAETIAQSLYAELGSVQTRLVQLQRVGAVHCTDRGTYIPGSADVTRDAELIAVEAKLLKWREAIEQAVSYLRFSNRSYVALPHETVRARRTEIVDECVRHSVGLIAVRPSGLAFVLKAPFVARRTPAWVWTVAKMFQRSISPSKQTSRKRRAMQSDD